MCCGTVKPYLLITMAWTGADAEAADPKNASRTGSCHEQRQELTRVAQPWKIASVPASGVVACGVGVLRQARRPRRQDADAEGEPGHGRSRRGEGRLRLPASD